MLPNIEADYHSEQYEMHLQIIARQKERLEKYKTHVLDKWFPLNRLGVNAIVGSFAITSTESKQRWILKPYAVNVGGGVVTPADLARDYIAIRYGGMRRRVTTEQWKEFNNDKRMTPLYCMPNQYDMAYYIDLKSAYYQIMQSVGWDVDYMPNQWLSRATYNDDFPYPDNKLARNCLVSIGLTGNMTMWYADKKQFTHKKKSNPFTNMMLWSLVQDILHAIAKEVIEHGAVYAYTDGYIVEEKHIHAVSRVLDSWLLPYGIKHKGKTDVKGTGAYKIGSHLSKPYNSSRRRYTDTIRNSDNTWLKANFVHHRKKYLQTLEHMD